MCIIPLRIIAIKTLNLIYVDSPPKHLLLHTHLAHDGMVHYEDPLGVLGNHNNAS